jgi:hypothetical protein
MPSRGGGWVSGGFHRGLFLLKLNLLGFGTFLECELTQNPHSFTQNCEMMCNQRLGCVAQEKGSRMEVTVHEQR